MDEEEETRILDDARRRAKRRFKIEGSLILPLTHLFHTMRLLVLQVGSASGNIHTYIP